ncbi:MAG TPA: thiamine phosphate synthase [Nitrospira sp.]|jgi:thiamine-phosphate pyrophosphorylase|nr:thiamine phosphate synthase [Nitrospira sp.]
MPQLESRLLVVTDRHQTNGRSLLSILQQVLTVGAPAIQLRERDLSAKDLLALTRAVQTFTTPRGSQLLVNDRIDVALSLDGVGVHLRSNSLPAAVARRLLGPQRLLGASAHSMDEAVRAEANGADYVVLGPVYETPSKQAFGPPLGLSKLEAVCQVVQVPIIGIGGVTVDRARDVRRAGAFGVAVITAILSAEDVEAATRALFDAVASVS